ncbi:hypothetical protein Halha_0293 [Halobacteroides halobius DSM 5150]|uniref:Uncharacterized protein TP-0789 domain-containing protein n=1 Tax=Halobacteroides halobius (strain ATCC 35273 / DSM 5150 / MD-1) TaxID=748449 RepID=L0K7J4_HALHC|nr:DUF4292 domain-containing protein [Halobacteroides halobius]AGB40304.1 hypothetical protein Halha_0293 [Halobacteroides halobius DSM 5150]
MKKYILCSLIIMILVLGNSAYANDISAQSLLQDIIKQMDQVKDFKGTIVTKVTSADKVYNFKTKVMKSRTRLMTQHIKGSKFSASAGRLLNTIPLLYLPPDYSTIMTTLPIEGQLDYQNPLQNLDKLYKIKLLGEAIYQNREVYILQLENLFSTQRIYIDKERSLITKIKVFNSSNIKVADISYTDFELFASQVWLPTKIKVDTLFNNSRLEIEYQDWKVNLGLTSFDFAKGFQSDYKDKINKLQNKLEKWPQNEELYWKISQIYQENDKLNQAITNLRNAILINNRIKYREELVRLLLLQGKYKEALGEVRVALQLDYNNPKLYYLLGKTQLQLGRVEQARYSLEKAVNYAPENITYLEKLFWVYYNLASKSDKYMLEQAEDTIQKLISLDKDNENYRIYLGDVYFKEGEVVKTAQAYNKAISLAPKDTWGYIKLAEFYKKTGKYSKAEELYRYIIYLDNSLRNRKRLANLYFKFNKYKLALKQYQIINERTADNFDIKLKLIECYLGAGANMKARLLIQQVLKEHSQGKIYLQLAQLAERYSLETAVDIYYQALQSNKKLTSQQQAKIYRALNRILYNQEKKWELKLLKDYLHLKSQGRIYQLLGKYQLKDGDLGQAINSFKLAIEYNNSAANYYKLAVSYLLAGKFDLVEDVSKKLINLEAANKVDKLLSVKNRLIKLREEFQSSYLPGRINYIEGNRLREDGKLNQALINYQAAISENYDYQIPRFYVAVIQALQGNWLEYKLAKSSLGASKLKLLQDLIMVLRSANIIS